MKKGLITSILALTFSGIQAQSPLPVPRLVVTLTIDQLRTDYMEAFSSLYGEDGFKRLLREGKVFRQMDFAFENIDRSSAVATLYTGTLPNLHGIVANEWMDRNTLRPTAAVEDQQFMGNYTDENSSPAQLLTSTLTDELKIGTGNMGMIYAIAPTRDAAILSAGHTANGAFWLNKMNGKWCGTTYFSEFPWWVSEFNDHQSPDFHIHDLVWSPLHPVTSYTFLPEWRSEAFKYKLDDDHTNRYRYLIACPFINDEINRLTEELLNKSTIGRDEVPDLLALTYYAGNYLHKSTQECAMEMQDTYARLDRSIADLLNLLDRTVGLKNVLLCVTSTGYTDSDGADISLYRIPGGEFYLNRCATLLNMYLMASFGEGQYVEGYHNLQIYLNHKLIEEKQLKLNDIQEEAANFLVQFSGVHRVYTSHHLLLGPWSPQMERIRNSFHRKRSGDLIIEVLPGWTVMQENSTNNRTVRLAPLPAPLILWGSDIKAEIIQTPVRADRLAPTLTGIMRIRAPNACQTQPISLQ